MITKNNIFGHKTCTFQREKNAYELTQKLKKLDAPPTPPQERDGLSRLVSLLHGNNMDSTIRVDQVEEREGKLCVKWKEGGLEFLLSFCGRPWYLLGSKPVLVVAN